MNNISVVIHTYNSASTLRNCLNSVKWTNEIIIIDMGSVDETLKIAKKYKSKIYFFKYTGYVEPARNFGISKVKNKWVLILDSDETISVKLKSKLIEISKQDRIDFVLIPRKNIIFNKWIKYTGWWPDHKIRFFKKSSVRWTRQIHDVPSTIGKSLLLPPHEAYSIHHENYQSISQFIERLNRYTNIESRKILKNGENVDTYTPFRKASKEFIQRFYMSEGYKDGFIGLLLSVLMSFYQFIAYAKVLENKKRLNEQSNSLNLIINVIILEGLRVVSWNFINLPLLKLARTFKRKIKQYGYI
ncbi:glycosyltransferase family 2 protein [Candidatus Gottesmanbacteria bacterium]|nr:glycosyltransferase family 2 protein [Candidatus Gottesmanbacteria bacterium]